MARGQLRICDRLEPVPEPYLKSIPSVRARPRIDSIVSWTELMKQAEAWGWVSIPTLNQTGDVEGRLLLDEQMGELVAEDVEILTALEVALPVGPGPDGVDDAGDQSLDARFAIGRLEGAAEVLGRHDVRGRLAPGRGDLDAVLFEDRSPPLVVDDGRSQLPGELVEGVASGFGEEPSELESSPALAVNRSSRFGSGVFQRDESTSMLPPRGLFVRLELRLSSPKGDRSQECLDRRLGIPPERNESAVDYWERPSEVSRTKSARYCGPRTNSNNRSDIKGLTGALA